MVQDGARLYCQCERSQGHVRLRHVLARVRFWLSVAYPLGGPTRDWEHCGHRGRVGSGNAVEFDYRTGLPPGGQTITSNPEGKPDHVRPGRGTHPTGTGLQPTTVHAICGRGCALALRRGYDLASAAVETRAAIMAMMSDLVIGSASETSKNPSSRQEQGSH